MNTLNYTMDTITSDALSALQQELKTLRELVPKAHLKVKPFCSGCKLLETNPYFKCTHPEASDTWEEYRSELFANCPLRNGPVLLSLEGKS